MAEQDPFIPRPEYPRPQFARRDWLNLNGVWEFAFDDADVGLAEHWGSRETPLGGDILVPFPFQSGKSGIGRSEFHDVLWYARWFEVPAEFAGRDLCLHFGAVDYEATVWVNGCRVGANRGGHVAFSFDVTPFLREGQNRLVVRVVDTQDPTQPRGKQFWELQPKGCHYTRTSGIWQTVWLEPLPTRRIEHLRLTPDVDGGAIRVQVGLGRPGAASALTVRVTRQGEAVAAVTVGTPTREVDLAIGLGPMALWSPEEPNLYDLELELSDGGGTCDTVASYFGMRKISIAGNQVLLNNRPYFQRLVLDQGYYPEGLLSAPGDDALRADVEWAKRFGFNGVRKHQKVEDPRFLYWCDRLGLLVWGEMANAWEYSPAGEEAMVAEWERVVRRDYNHPCVAVWVPFNESWGIRDVRHCLEQQGFVRRIVNLTRALDPTRLVVDNDGWEHSGDTDLCTIHDYTPCGDAFHQRYAAAASLGEFPLAWDQHPIFLEEAGDKPVLFTEVGGYLAEPPEGSERDLLFQFYGSIRSSAELVDRYDRLMRGIARLGHAAGFCYTQLTDVEHEVNGLLTYDRRPKVDPAVLAALHERLFTDRQG
jgi:beta-galactosidase/beta-glucuronidase